MGEKMKKKIDFTKKYDNVLDIKSIYSYKRKLPKIDFRQVGLEIEISVNYRRDQFSFIKSLLLKMKEAVGDKGYFVKDGTVLGNYQFEIVLDPLYPNELNKIFQKLKDIIDHSEVTFEISSEKNCGIHLNFNKLEIVDKKVAHQRLLSLILENRDLFEENIYKKFKFIWDYSKYFEYQKTISSKYLAVNYLKKRVVEIRNIKVSIKPEKLIKLIKLITVALYKENLTDEEIKKMKITPTFDVYSNIKRLLEKSFESVNSKELIKKIKDEKLLIISLKDDIPKIISRDELEKGGK